MDRVKRSTVTAVVLQLLGLVLFIGWGYAVWRLPGAFFVGALVLLFLGFVVAQPGGEPAPAVPAPAPDEVSWTF